MEDAQDFLVGNLRPGHGRQAPGRQLHRTIIVFGIAGHGHAARHLQAGVSLVDQVEDSRNRPLHVDGRLSFLEALSGFRPQVEANGRASDSRGLEVGALEKELRRRLLHLAVQASHHSGQSDGLLRVPDEQIVGQHFPLLAVQGGESALFAHGRHANRRDPIAVEGVGGLAEFEHGVVGHIDGQVHRALAQGVQSTLHHHGRWNGCLALELDAAVAGTVFEILDRERVCRQLVVGRHVGHGERLEGTFENSRELPGESVMAPEVRSMGPGSCCRSRSTRPRRESDRPGPYRASDREGVRGVLRASDSCQVPQPSRGRPGSCGREVP